MADVDPDLRRDDNLGEVIHGVNDAGESIGDTP